MFTVCINTWQHFKDIKDPIVGWRVGPERYIHILTHGNCECELKFNKEPFQM